MTSVELYRFERSRRVDRVTPLIEAARIELAEYAANATVRGGRGKGKPVMILQPRRRVSKVRYCRTCPFPFTPTANYQLDCGTCMALIPARLRMFPGRRTMTSPGVARYLSRPCRCCLAHFDPIGSKTRDCPTCHALIPKRLREASTRRPTYRVAGRVSV